MTKLPKRYGPFVYGVIQSGLTTAIATGIALAKSHSIGPAFVAAWSPVWLMAWVTMLPIVLGASPLIQRAVDRLTE